MEFGDSFFDESDDEEKSSVEQKKLKKISYNARFCEQKWYLVPSEQSRSHKDRGSIHDMAFMTMKYNADLLYSQGKHLEAIVLYKELLDIVPKENGCVVRELRDALARTYLKVGDAETARDEVLQLLVPPRDSAWTSWRLLAQCHKQLQDIEAEAASLQKAIIQQRSFPGFWISLGSSYRSLQHEWIYRPKGVVGASLDVSETSGEESIKGIREEDDHSSMNSCEGGIKSLSVLEDILKQTVQLFRPYFSWRTELRSCESSEVGNVTTDEGAALISNNDKSDQTGHLPLKFEALSISGCCLHCCDHFNDEATASHSNDTFKCTSLCPLYGTSLARNDGLSSEIYSSKLVESIMDQKTNMEDKSSAPSAIQSSTPLQLCHRHSLFVVLVKGIVSPEAVVKLVKSLRDTLHCQFGLNSLMKQFAAMAECSCLMWARQLLQYSSRHSASFAKESVVSDLLTVETSLKACQTSVLEYIKEHLTKRMVFDEVD